MGDKIRMARMRKDETGRPCPQTLGEYYDLTKVLFGENNKAAEFLQSKIDSNESGRDEIVVAADSQMRSLIFMMAGES
jgi:hypothetical protein